MLHGSHLRSGSSFLAIKLGCGLTFADPSEEKVRYAGSLVKAASSLTLAPEAKAIRKMALLSMNLEEVSEAEVVWMWSKTLSSDHVMLEGGGRGLLRLKALKIMESTIVLRSTSNPLLRGWTRTDL